MLFTILTFIVLAPAAIILGMGLALLLIGIFAVGITLIREKLE